MSHAHNVSGQPSDQVTGVGQDGAGSLTPDGQIPSRPPAKEGAERVLSHDRAEATNSYPRQPVPDQPPQDSQCVSVDATIARAHQHVTGPFALIGTQGTLSTHKNLPLGEAEPGGHGIGSSRGGLTTKIHCSRASCPSGCTLRAVLGPKFADSHARLACLTMTPCDHQDRCVLCGGLLGRETVDGGRGVRCRQA